MANQEHLDLLRQGVETWNRWRQEHFDIQPDLSKADLRHIIHRDANLHGTNLAKADLRRTDLRYANLTQARLSGANLTGANLSGAHLSRSDLTRTNLTNADLSKAIVKRANLTDAKLVGTQLIETDLGRAIPTGCAMRFDNRKKPPSFLVVTPTCILWCKT
ncbi:MAG TPA: pentapeptide repeat-containing protein [Ktedonobacteraceae bacterium]|nr:pentapeptide repeat-containing protein [Ktedonobacteraceae bacterium]